ncbi:MAG: hypothetical protein J1E34_03335 [Oscillospiraceae bacterium]|nr:hypothetical protein [Oscillospiraceae bacterium]
MSMLEFFQSLFGDSSKYDFLYYIFSCVGGLIVIDGVLRFLFGSVSSLFKR